MAGPDPLHPATLDAPRLDFATVLAGAPDLRGVRIVCPDPETLGTGIASEVMRVWSETREAASTLSTG